MYEFMTNHMLISKLLKLSHHTHIIEVLRYDIGLKYTQFLCDILPYL